MNVRDHKDFAAGLLFIALGVAFAVIATNYRLGTAGRMGPGYFPIGVGVLLTLLGTGVLVKSLRPGAAVSRIIKPDWRVLAFILGAVLIFALTLRPLGLVAAIALAVISSSLASREFEWTSTLLTAALLAAFCSGVFVFGLGLQFRLLPAFAY